MADTITGSTDRPSSSNDAPNTNARIEELARKYNVSRSTIEQLLLAESHPIPPSATHANPMQRVILDEPLRPAEEPIGSPMAAATPAPTIPVETNTQKRVTINSANPTAKTSSSSFKEMRYERRTSNPWAIAGLILGVLLIGFLLVPRGCYRQRHIDRTAVIDVPNEIPKPAPIPIDSNLRTKQDTLPPVLLQAKREPLQRTAIRRRVTHKSLVVRRTSSSFDAQETLASLRADGNDRAHIVSRNRHGVPLFSVRRR